VLIRPIIGPTGVSSLLTIKKNFRIISKKSWGSIVLPAPTSVPWYGGYAQRKAWCFTLNNPRQHNGRAIASLLREASCSFIIIGREYSDDGTPHLQGYCEFRRPSSLKDCKEINEYAHWEKAIASRSSNIEYCRKSDQDPYLFQDKKKVPGLTCMLSMIR